MDSSKTTPLSESSPSGLYVEKLSNTYVERRWFLIFSPSNEELLLKVKVPYLDSFVRDLNNLLEEVKNEKQKTHSKN